MKYILNCRIFYFYIIKICYAQILKVRKHISVIMKLNILVQNVFLAIFESFLRKTWQGSALQLDLTSKEGF